MELKAYLNILSRKWWIVLPTFLITLTAGIVFTYTQTPIYRATATYVVVPSSSFEDVRSYTNGLATLGQRTEIATTFAEIASSDRIRRLAFDSLSLESGQRYSTSSTLRRGTNIIEVSAEGPDPVIARDLANAVGANIEEYVQGLYEVFRLVPLDEAKISVTPISPKTFNNLMLATLFGLVLGGGLAFLAEYLEVPSTSVVSVNIFDDKTGVYNEEYFLRRLGEEMVRAKRNRYPLSLALMQVDNLSLLKGANSTKVRTELLRQVAMLTSQYLREEDMVAYLESNVFALLLPDTTGENAKALMEYLHARIAWTPFESSTGLKFNLKSSIGITPYNYNGTSRDELVTQARQALQLAGIEENGKAFLITPDQRSLDETTHA